MTTETTGRRPGRRRRAVTIVVAGVAVAGAVAGGLAIVGTPWSSTPAAAEPTPATGLTTVAVESRVLQHTVAARGTIGHETRGKLTTQRAGTVTTAPAAGTVLAPGTVVVRIDDAPVIALRGALPAWRALEPGMTDGNDVRQLEQALGDAGMSPGKVDATFTTTTEAAVKRWQKAVGAEQTGRIALGDVVFLPEDLRVATTSVEAGDRVEAGAQLGSLGVQSPSLSVVLQPSDGERVHADARVSVSLPSGTTTPGTVVAVGPVRQPATASSGSSDAGSGTGSGSGSGSGSSKPELPVLIRFDDPAAVEGLDQSVVKVDIDARAEPEGLVVPVAAILAAARDSSAVQVVAKGTVTTRVVELGATAGGDVVISSGLREGELVVVPS